jgi:diguanylate cyclase (GGDEF)-like protein
MALLCLDVEDFAAVNEQFGHAVGDALLAEIASRLKEAVPELMPDRSTRQAERAMGTVARITGDRFALVLQECGKTKAERIGKKLRELLEVPFETSQGTVQLSANIGVAVWESNLPSPPNADELLRTAETALYEVKKEENRIYTFRPSDKIDAGRLRRREGLRQAIDEDELTLHYQPIVELEDRSVVEVEALVRWNHSEEGLLPPGQFIPLAEESGLAGALDRWVLREALRQVAEWRRTGRGPETVSVNVTVPTEGTGELEKAILQLLEQEHLPGEALTIELTERVAFRHTSPFDEFRNCGGRLAIDDFGTGHSALFYLRQFEADLLKIDQAFVEELDIAGQTDVLVRASLEIANRLGMEAVAEGVETEAQLSVLRDLDCSFGQGYLFARPMPAQELEDLMEGRGENG